MKVTKATWTAVAAGLVVIILALIGTIKATERPKFCTTCHEMQKFYDSWAESDHKDQGCLKCHAAPGTLGLVKTKVSALKEVYAHITKTYSEPIVAKKQTNFNCDTCHQNVAQVKEVGDLIIPHEKHLESGVDCLTCHKGLVHGPEGEGPVSPGMKTCSRCHDVQDDKTCSTCHKGLGE